MTLDFQLSIILAEVIIAGGLVFLTVVGLLVPVSIRAKLVSLLALFFLVAAALALLFDNVSGAAFHKLVIRNQALDYLKLVVILGTGLTILVAPSYLSQRGIHYFEFYIFLLAALLGGMVAISTTHFLTLLVGIELLSVSSYIMCGLNRHSQYSVEAAMKYFLLGSFSTAILLFGIAFIYGATGQLHFGVDIFPPGPLGGSEKLLLMVGGIFFIAGLGFKIAAAPLHFWVADVYKGAPTPVAAFLTTVPKVVLFGVLYSFVETHIRFAPWAWELFLLALLSLLVGNAMAFLQKDLKKLIAFSTISHNGYLLVMVLFHAEVVPAVLTYYLLAYLLGSFGVFSIIIHISGKKDHILIRDLNGLFYRNPKLTLLFTFFLLSLAGIPFTPGFLGKLFLIYQIFTQGGIFIIGLVILNSALAAGYYIMTIASCFKQPKEASLEPASGSMNYGLTYLVVILISLVILIWPQALLVP